MDMMGTSKELEINFTQAAMGVNNKGNDFIAFKGDFEFDRVERGMSSSSIISDSVTVDFEVEFVQ